MRPTGTAVQLRPGWPFLLGLFLLLVPLGLPAQVLELRGVVRAADTGQPLPYASLRVEGQAVATLSNAEGVFVLRVPAAGQGSRLRVASLGYASEAFSLATLASGDSVTLRLRPQPYTLAAVTIYPEELSARALLEQALRHRRANSPEQPYGMRAFYRHYCQESGIYGRLIEGAFDLYDAEGHVRLRRDPAQKVTVALRQVRRSLDFTRLSGHRHAPLALYQTLARDVTSYHSPLSRHHQDPAFQCTYQDTAYYDGRVVYVVRLSGHLKGSSYQAEVTIAADDFAILQVDEHMSQHWRNGQEQVIDISHDVTRYQAVGGRYYLYHLQNDGRRIEQYLDEQGQPAWSRDHAHRVSLLVHEIVRRGMTPLGSREPGEAALAAAPYDPAFWAGYPELAATPLEAAIAADLAARWPLEQQFALRAGETLPPAVQDRLSEAQLDRLLASQRGQAMALVFWDSQAEPSLRDLLRVRKLVQATGAQGLGLVFLSLDQDPALWQAAIRQRRLFAFDHLRLGQGRASPLAQRYGVGDLPWLVLLDPQGTARWQGTGLPPGPVLEAFRSE